MPFLAPNGVELYHEVHGTAGEPLVLVHGFTGDITDWRHQIAEFSPSHRVLVLDNRGHGRSAAPPEREAYTIEQMADDVVGLADRLGLGRYHLLGHSMGGAIAQEIALRHPERLRSLVLEDTSFAFGNLEPRMPESPPPLPQERLDEIMARLGRMSQDVLRACWRALRQWPGTEDRAPAIGVPTLILCGDGDAPELLAGSRRLAELIPQSELCLIPGAGHSPQEECPQQFNRVLRAFLARL